MLTRLREQLSHQDGSLRRRTAGQQVVVSAVRQDNQIDAGRHSQRRKYLIPEQPAFWRQQRIRLLLPCRLSILWRFGIPRPECAVPAVVQKNLPAGPAGNLLAPLVQKCQQLLSASAGRRWFESHRRDSPLTRNAAAIATRSACIAVSPGCDAATRRGEPLRLR